MCHKSYLRKCFDMYINEILINHLKKKDLRSREEDERLASISQPEFELFLLFVEYPFFDFLLELFTL